MTASFPAKDGRSFEFSYQKHLQQLLRRFRVAVYLILFFLGLSARILAANLSKNDPHNFWIESLGEIGSFVAVGIVVAFLYEQLIRNEERRFIFDSIGTIIDEKINHNMVPVFPEGRATADDKRQLLESARQEVVVVGTALRALVSYFDQLPADRFRTPVAGLLARGVNIRCLLLNPDGQYVRLAANAPELKAKIEGSIRSLRKLREQFNTAKLGGQFQISLYDHQPYFSAIAVDMDQVEGHIYFNPYMCEMPNAEAPAFLIANGQQGRVFQKFHRSLTNQVKLSTPLE